MLNVRDTSDFIARFSAQSQQPVIVISFSLVNASISLNSNQELLEVIETHMSDLDEDIIYSLESGQSAICEMSTASEASAFLARLEQVFAAMPDIGLSAVLYHNGALVTERSQLAADITAYQTHTLQ